MNNPGKSRSSQHKRSKVDGYVGQRLRCIRQDHGLELEYLARLLQIPIDDLAAAEDGRHRLTSDELVQIGRLLGVPFSHFFHGLDQINKSTPVEIPTDKTKIVHEDRLVELVNLATAMSAEQLDRVLEFARSMRAE